MYFTRERHRRDRVYFGPYSSAQAGARDARPARPDLPDPIVHGRGAGAALGLAVPRLPHQPLRGPVCRLRHARGVPPLDRPRRRLPRRPLRRDRARARRADVGRRRGLRSSSRRRSSAIASPAVRSLLERQRVANAAVGTLDAIAVALAGDGCERPGVPGARRRPLGPPVVLPRQRGAAPARPRCSRSSCSSTTSTPRRCRRSSSSRSRSRRRSPRRSACGAARASRCARPSGARSAGSSSSRRATRRSRSRRSS